MYKPSNIQSIEQIEAALSEIQPFVETDYNADIMEAVINRAQTLEVYLAQSAKLVADAKYRYNEFLNSQFVQAVKDAIKINMPIALTNKYVESLCKDYKYLVDWSDRINATLTHELDFARTLISKLKEEMRNNLYQH